jgi:hypothetical protein
MKQSFFKRIILFTLWQWCRLQAALRVAMVNARYGWVKAFNAWPTTSTTGNGNAPAGQYIANGTATTILWGTSNFTNITGFLVVTRIREQTMMAFDTNLEQGDGFTAGKVQGIDGFRMELDVRDDTNQVTSALTVGQRLQLQDGGGLVPGGRTIGSLYSCIITGHDWETAPKIPAGRTLTVEKFLLIT